MTAHSCRVFDPACWRCDLNADELDMEDARGRQVRLGDTVAVAVRVGNSAAIRVGKVMAVESVRRYARRPSFRICLEYDPAADAVRAPHESRRSTVWMEPGPDRIVVVD